MLSCYQPHSEKRWPLLASGLLSVSVMMAVSCAGGVKEPAPGPSLPDLQVYDATEAVGPVSRTALSALKVFVETADLSEGLRMRLRASLHSDGGSGALAAWPATFAFGNAGETMQPGSSGYTHLLRFSSEGRGLRVRLLSLGPKGEVETSSSLLALLERRHNEDGGVDFLASNGQPLRMEDVPPPGLTTESQRQLADLVRGMGMGSLRVYSGAAAEVFLDEGNRQIPLGVTPVDAKLRAGPHQILVRRKGQTEQKLRIRVEDGQQRGLFAHWPDDVDPGSLVVFTSPPGLRLALNGEVIGDSPVARPGLLHGGYDIEVARSEQDQASVLVTDHIEVYSNLRADRFYPLLYHFRPSGARLRSAVEEGLWNYSAANRSFAIGDYDQVKLPPESGIVSTPIGSRDLQGEILLPTDGAAFGFYGEKGRFLVFPGEGAIRVQVEQDGALASYVTERGKRPQIYIYFEIDPDANSLLLRADGMTLYDGPFVAGMSGRLVLLGTQGGSRLPEEMLLRSGPEKKGFLYRLNRSLWLRSRSLMGSPLRLKDEEQ